MNQVKSLSLSINSNNPVFFIFFLIFILISCNESTPSTAASSAEPSIIASRKVVPPARIINPSGATIATRFNTPTGYQRTSEADDSFAAYLRQLPLKRDGAKVFYFNGNTNNVNNVYCAVVDLPIGKKDLHQCADAVMRLKADYHWKQKEYDQIKFNFTNGFPVAYTEWRKGKRMIIKGNKTYWDNGQKSSTSYQDYWNYLELIFTYAGTASLSKEMKSIDLSSMKIGDILIQGGHPGHAVIVVDMAKNSQTGQQVFLLAQSYMPAQELQILQNPNDSDQSPWYALSADSQVVTPEWVFSSNDLKQFQ